LGKIIWRNAYDLRVGGLTMNNRLLGIATCTFLILLPATVSAQSINALNAQLKQAVNLRNWNQAIQILDKMIATEPGQAARLEAYKAQVRQQLNPKIGTVSTSSTTSTLSPSVPNNSTETGNVTVTEALVSRSGGSYADVTVDEEGRFTPPSVTYNLTGEIYNGTSGTVSYIKIYYEVLSWNKANNKSGSLILMDAQTNTIDVQAHRKLSFKKRLQWESTPLDSKHQYEGVKVRINKVEWLNEDGSRGSNDTRRLFGYWGKL
jgi:hypothetical protein